MFTALQIQADLYKSVYKNMIPLSDMLKIDEYATTQDISADFVRQMSSNAIEDIARSCLLLDSWANSVWGLSD